MPIVGAVVLLIQFCFAYHALKSGRPDWWVFIIMGFPVMGCVIYYFVEVFPGSREQRRAAKAARAIARVLEPDAELKKRVADLEVCGSVDNRMALAEECMQHQIYPEAIKLYESCLTGAYAGDGTLLYGLSRAAVEAHDWARAAGALERLKRAAPRTRPAEVGLLEAHAGARAGGALERLRRRAPRPGPAEVGLLEARLLEGRGETDAALAAYRA